MTNNHPAPRPGERRGLLQAHPRQGEGVEAGREGRPPAGPHLGHVKAVERMNGRVHRGGFGCRGEAGQQRLCGCQPYSSHGTAAGTRRHRPEMPHGAPHTGQGRHRQSSAAGPSSTGSGAGACPRRECWCRLTAATIPLAGGLPTKVPVH